MTTDLVTEICESCLVTKARVVSRVLTGIYDEALREFGINSPQFILLVIISKLGPVTRAAVGRFHRQSRSALTRNLQVMIGHGWIDEVVDDGGGKGRPLVVTRTGEQLIAAIEPAWRSSQAEAAKLLGESAVVSVSEVAERLMDLREAF